MILRNLKNIGLKIFYLIKVLQIFKWGTNVQIKYYKTLHIQMEENLNKEICQKILRENWGTFGIHFSNKSFQVFKLFYLTAL